MRRRLKRLSERARVELRWDRFQSGLWFAAGFALVWGFNASRDRWFPSAPELAKLDPANQFALRKSEIAAALGIDKMAEGNLPPRLRMRVRDVEQDVRLEYSLDPELQAEVDELIGDYTPDYAALVAMDAATGRILAMSSYIGPGADSGDRAKLGNLAVRASFPAASIFKVVTATAAIDRGQMTGQSLIQFSGSNHTLYRSNVLSSKTNRWSRTMRLSDAFAKSVNTVFAKLGVFHLGPQALGEYAGRYGFNQPVPADFPVDPGRVEIPDDAWGLAEVASGFTRDTTMSPVQGAMIAAAIANDGVMMEPYVVDRVRGFDDQGRDGGGLLYEAIPRQARITFDRASAREIRELMQSTVAHGTSRKSFRGIERGPARHVEVGGKTGSLTGYEPFGKYDWFVGYATGRGRAISVAVMTAHRKYWKVKSSYLARRTIESFFKRVPDQNASLRPASEPSS